MDRICNVTRASNTNTQLRNNVLEKVPKSFSGIGEGINAEATWSL
jgi:hypothetical protein